MARSPVAARATLAAAAMVLLAGVVIVSVPGLLSGTKIKSPRATAPTSSTTPPPSTSTTLPPSPATSVTTQAPASSPPEPVAISHSAGAAGLPNTGTQTRMLVAGGIALLLLGGVLVLSQQPAPYTPRHLRRRKRSLWRAGQ